MYLEEQVHAFFQHLHNNPEISWKEHKTTQFLCERLSDMGYKIQTFEHCTGLVAELGSEKPVIAVRADIDALWQMVEGEYKANHSCGHDAHMAVVLGVASKFAMRSFKGTVKFIFQPAEELGDGALKMIEQGVMQNVDYLFGLHLRPQNELGYLKFSPAIYHGATCSILGKIEGADTHGARPHLGENAIELANSIINMLNTIHLDPAATYSVKMTTLHAGGINTNIIPGKAEFSLDLRAENNAVMEELMNKTQAKLQLANKMTDSTVSFHVNTLLPAAIVDTGAKNIMAQAILETYGEIALADDVVTTGSDDFHFYTQQLPYIRATMLGVGCDLRPGLHAANMKFNVDALYPAMCIIERSIEIALSIKEGGTISDEKWDGH
ncbi:amidohydrolase [Peribacillus butanolivorans]|uniref:amidohydrolase n=1 Tax=Peribacillus butanolivorans TaxID=421767 RepID=UPI003663B601